MVGEGSGSGAPIVEDRLRRRAGLVLGDVLASSELLNDGGCIQLQAAVRACGVAVCEADSVDEIPLEDMGDGDRRRQMRSALESVLARRWDYQRIGDARLGDLTPGAGLLPDGSIPPDACGARLHGVLDRAGWDRWGALLDRTVAEVAGQHNVGTRAMGEIIGMCFERSLEGAAVAGVAEPAADDLAVLVRYEQNEPSQPLIEALLELRSGDAPVGVREAADRLVRDRAPSALAVDAALTALLEAAGDQRTRDLFAAWSSWQGPHSLQQLARDASISPQRSARIVYRADSRIRAALAASRGPVPWMVSALGRRLGPAATEEEVLAALARLGVSEGHADLALWLAGPYRAVPTHPGWLAWDPQGLVARTSACLTADGGVRRLVDVTAELGLPTDRMASWLHASGAVVVHDLSVSTLGKLVDVVERVLDAHGRPVTPSDMAACLDRGGRVVTEAQLASTLRGRRFRQSGDGAVGLADWNDPPATLTSGRGSRSGSQARPATVSPVPTRADDVDPSRGDGRLWLWVRVDAEVLRGGESVVPAALVDGLGIAAATRRTFASQYGPMVLAHEGAQPVRGSARAVVLAAGARDGDTLLMGFSARGDFLVEVRRATFQAGEADPGNAEFTLFPKSVSGGTP